MKLEASPVRETSLGMAQIMTRVANLTLQLNDIKKGKEIREEVWCTKFKLKSHHKDQCPLF